MNWNVAPKDHFNTEAQQIRISWENIVSNLRYHRDFTMKGRTDLCGYPIFGRKPPKA